MQFFCPFGKYKLFNKDMLDIKIYEFIMIK